MSFRYDATGNRIEKKLVKPDNSTIITRYVRDASGNVMAVYDGTAIKEMPIYGSSRTGMYKGGRSNARRTLGKKSFELSNHLGNVLSVITDNIRMAADSAWATVITSEDYYAFGSDMPDRKYTENGYRYGFNGKEKDEDGEWGSTAYDYGFRIYDPRIAKFLSVDPLTKEYPWYTPYQFAGNTPIQAIDLDGLEEQYVIEPDLIARITVTTLFDTKHSIINTFNACMGMTREQDTPPMEKETKKLRLSTTKDKDLKT